MFESEGLTIRRGTADIDILFGTSSSVFTETEKSRGSREERNLRERERTRDSVRM
jgi:hypothetical protein